MAVALAPKPSSQVSFALYDAFHTRLLMIRPIGKGPFGSIHFVAMEDNHENPVFCYKHAVAFNIKMTRDGSTEVQGRQSPLTILTSRGGLHDATSLMKVKWENGEEFGEIDHHKLKNLFTKSVMKISNVWDGHEQFNIKIEHTKDGCKKTMAVITGIKNWGEVKIEFMCKDIIGIDKLLIIMSAFKSVITAFELHKSPMPSTILSLSSVSKEPEPTLNIFQCFTELLFRPSYQGKDGRRFIDIMTIPANDVVLVLENPSAVIHKLTFYSVTGVILFTAHTNINNEALDIVTFKDKLIGHFKGGEFFDPNTIAPIMKDQLQKQKYLGKYQVKLTIDHSPVAQLIQENNSDIVRFQYLKNISIEHKILTLTGAARAAVKYLKICAACLPAVESYPYRPKCGRSSISYPH